MCACASSLQPVLHTGSAPCGERPEPRGLHKVPSWRIPLRPPPSLCSEKDPREAYPGGIVCRRLCPHGTQREPPAGHRRPICRCGQTVRSHNQSREDRGPGPASAEHNTSTASHHHWWSPAEVCGQFQVPGQHDLRRRITGQRDHFQDPESQPSTRQTESESPAAERNHALNKAEDLQSRSPPPHSYTAVRHGPCTVGISNSWSNSTIGLCVWSWAYAGRTESPTKKCWTELDKQASSRCCWSLRCAGQAMSSEWRRTAYPDRSCMESLKMVHANKDAQNWDTKTLWRATSKWSGIQPRQLEAYASDRSGWRSLTYKATAAFDEDRRQRLRCSKGQTSQGSVHLDPKYRLSVFNLWAPMCFQASDCGATCVVIAECIANVIIGSRWTTKKNWSKITRK